MSIEHHHEPTGNQERVGAELESIAKAKLEALRQSKETDPGDAAERADAARETIRQHEQTPEPADQAEAAPTKPTQHPLLNPRLNYAHTLSSLQRHLAPASRRFSQIIHTPIIEKTSEAMERTVARPSVVLGATWTALIVGGLFYFTARYFGYTLSGSEMLFSFIIGAILGLMLEGIMRALRRR